MSKPGSRSASPQPGSEIVLAVEKAVAGGRMLARHEGQIVFVSGAIPGERVRARVERLSRHLIYAETREVLEASPDRRDAVADPACGGSLYAHVAYERQLQLKADVIADAFARIAKLRLPSPVAVMPSPEEGYRVRARLRARGARVGFFREGTHDLCDAGPTRQLLPEAVDAVSRLAAVLAGRGARVLEYEIAENIRADERVVIAECEPPGAAIEGVAAVDGITGLAYASLDHPSPTPVYGSLSLVDRIDVMGTEVTLAHHARSFFQGNRWILPQFAARVLSQVPDGPVVDLYSGVGLFAVSLAANGRREIVAVEGDGFGARDLDANARPFAGAIVVRQESVEDYLDARHARLPWTVVLDPPRTGVSAEAMPGLIALKPQRIVYVSCDVATLARDVKRLGEAGYQVEHIEAFDMFPNTAHVETLVTLVIG